VEVPLIEDLASNIRIQLPKAPNLPVLLGDQLLVHRGDLDEQIIVREVEVGPEVLGGLAGVVPLDGEGAGLVVPGDVVEVEQPGELSLALVCKVCLVRGARTKFAG
jgi:hypothetical protein